MTIRSRFLIIIGFLLLYLPVHSQYMHRSGQKILDKDGHEIVLRGMGLGGWMLQEPYMMEMSGLAIAQWQIKSKIQSLIGPENTQLFYDAWHANHCSKADIDSLAAWGFNSVRLPMHYNLYTLPIEKEPVAGQQTWLEKGFAMTDSLIKWCGENHIYVILDLHAAPGGQGMDYAICDGNPALPSLWEDDANKVKTIELWKKLASRYANEPWVGGYDILNEPNWSFTSGGNQNGCSENSNAPLKQLLIQITAAIRSVDQNHLIIIEGNCWGNNYNGMLPPWDNNMALSFHKYWSTNDIGSIQGILNLRSQHNIPIWMGESGENSNVWFTDAISLVESQNIGWAWWPMKKINSVVGPLTITKTPEYQILLDYWKSGGTAPASGFAMYTLMQMATNSKMQFCTFHKDVIDAMFRQVHDSTSKTFKIHHIPGFLSCSEYDLGRVGVAYDDADLATYQVSTGSYTAWNQGYAYRNDGVDIEVSSDVQPGSNGFNIGWTEDHEWLLYTVTVDSTAVYNLKIRHASGASNIRLFVNGGEVSDLIQLPSTTTSQTWSTKLIQDVVLYKGENRMKIYFEKGGCNLENIQFSIAKGLEEISFIAVAATTDENSGAILLSLNKNLDESTLSNSDFTCTVNGSAVAIQSVELMVNNPSILKVALTQPLTSIDIIRISYSGTQLKATDGTSLMQFQDLVVRNTLPIYTPIPGKIEAEDFVVNQGLSLETTTDLGGGKNIGYTNAGDFLEYRVRVNKSSDYLVELRIACLSNPGSIKIELIGEDGNAVNQVTIPIPTTGGWQTWRTISSTMTMTQGLWKMKVTILDPEFNLNWYRFTDKSTGLIEPTNLPNLYLYPNPAKDEVKIMGLDNKNRIRSLRFLSMRGTTVKIITHLNTHAGTSEPIDVGDLSSGLYLVECLTEAGMMREKLFIEY